MDKFITTLEDAEAFASPLINHLPHAIGIVDSEHRLVGLNSQLGTLAGFNTPGEAIGTTAAEMKCDAAELYEVFFEQDDNVLQGGNETTFVISNYIDNQLKAFLSQKILYTHSDETKYALFTMTNIPLQNMVNIINQCDSLPALSAKKLHGSYSVISPQQYLALHHNLQLTTRQSECLYYLLRGMTNKSVAKQLGISHRTVDDHVLRLKTIFHCDNRNQLIEKGVELGLTQVVPPSLIDCI